MKIGSEDKKKLAIAGVLGFFALLAAFYLYSQLFGGPSTPPPPPVVVAVPAKTAGPSPTVSTPPGNLAGQGAAVKVGTSGAQLDPTLHMEAMLVTESLAYTGSGRNIFAAGAAAEPAVKMIAAVAPARPIVASAPPPSPQPAGPPPLPPINLKFFGTATAANGTRRAFLLNGDDVFLASAGDVVQRRYRVVSIAANSILVEDVPNNNKQTLPLMGN